MKIVLLIIFLITLPFMPARSYSQIIDQQKIELFCSNKPIWSAFSITPEQCSTAVKQCLKQKRFSGIDPEKLSEAFYECVFKKLDIEIE